MGYPTWLDIERISGDIDEQMAGNISNSKAVLVIGTQRYTDRSQQNTNVKKEFDAIIAKSKEDPSFLVYPLKFSNTAQNPFPDALKDHPNCMDFTGIDDGEDYIQRLADQKKDSLQGLFLIRPKRRIFAIRFILIFRII